MAKPKILFIGQFAPPVHGVSVMNDYVIKSKVLTAKYDFVKVNLTTANSIGNIGKMGIAKYLKFMGIALKTFFFLIKGNYSLAYITLSPIGYAFTKDSMIVRMVKWFNVPVVLHLHGKGIDNAIDQGSAKARKKYNKVFRDTHVICLSKSLLKDIRQITSSKKVHIVNNGIPAPAKENEYESNHINILMLSNLIKSKGSLDLLAAISILVNKGFDNFTVHFAGAWGEAGFEHEFNTFIQEHSLEKYISMMGPVFGEEKAELLSMANIFVLPTYYPNECFPLTILEAMSYGLAVIASNEGAIPDMIDHGKNGYIVKAKSPEELAGAVESLIKDDDLTTRMGSNGAQKFSAFYRLDIFEKNMLSVFESINTIRT